MKRIAILGSTGSIGTQALEVIAQHKGLFKVVALAAGENVELLAAQARIFSPKIVSISNTKKEKELKEKLADIPCKVVSGDDALQYLVIDPEIDMVLVAITGVKALIPTLKAIDAGKDIALASKEILVAAGHIVMDAVKRKGINFLPVDSEHSAVMQSMAGNSLHTIEKIILTASGGPFFGYTHDKIKTITLEDALAHPNWNMGRKITIDSATLINKGLEVIEAHWLFNVPYDNIDVVVHRESIIHSLVSYCDGSVIAQLGMPDMRLPIQYALSYPERLPSDWPRISLSDLYKLTFYEPDRKLFPCLDLAYQSGRQGGTAPVVLNAANEEAVSLFLQKKIKFTDIALIIEEMLGKTDHPAVENIDDIVAVDLETRIRVREAY